MKKILQVLSIPLLLVSLSGCPIMMVPMMGPMMKDMWNSGDPKVEAVVQELVREGVADLGVNRGTYDAVRLENAKVHGRFIQEDKFRNILVKALPSAGEWKGVDGEKAGQVSGEGTQGKSLYASAPLNAELYKEGDMFHLSLDLADPGSREVVWKADFSRPAPRTQKPRDH
ncbi:MAG: hypothetical protein C4576_00375 [Desulfobacteraceae bacterium]|nr:MAG: hypothetical protein C4576_00375 [Desulfobacteraceae bacterium]